MPNYSTYGTLAGSSYNISVSPSGDGERPPRTPSGLVVTHAVQTRDGWRGQVIVDKEIVFEGDPIAGEDAAEHAIQEANRRVVEVFKALFRDSERPSE